MKPWSPFPYSHTCVVRYQQEFSINPAVGVSGDYVFSANGLYDPNITGVGHQPYGFDQLMVLFDHYTVTASRLRLRLSSNNAIPFWMTCLLSDTNVSLAGNTSEIILEIPSASSELIGYNTSSVGKGDKTVAFDASKFFYIKNFVGKTNYRGDAGSNPVEQAYFHCILSPNATGDDVANQVCWATIEYEVTFTEPRILPPS